MNRRAAGVIFFAIAALLFATRYLAAAIFGSGVNSWDANLFRAMLEYVGDVPLNLSILAALLGAMYLVWAELGERAGR